MTMEFVRKRRHPHLLGAAEKNARSHISSAQPGPDWEKPYNVSQSRVVPTREFRHAEVDLEQTHSPYCVRLREDRSPRDLGLDA